MCCPLAEILDEPFPGFEEAAGFDAEGEADAAFARVDAIGTGSGDADGEKVVAG